jgi:hypothetical protein
MNKILALIIVNLFLGLQLVAQSNVGISNLLPTEKLHVDSGAIKVGKNAWAPGINYHWIKFGDVDFVRIGEDGEDDKLFFYAKNFVFEPSIDGYDGNVGIGETNPTAKLDLVGTMRYRDGNEGVGKVLTSDFLGNATWQNANNFPALTMKVCMALEGDIPVPGTSGLSNNVYIGEIRVFPYSFVPKGWIECKGQTLSVTTYPDLFNLLGTTYGGNGTSTFGVPDFTGKVIIGQ